MALHGFRFLLLLAILVTLQSLFSQISPPLDYSADYQVGYSLLNILCFAFNVPFQFSILQVSLSFRLIDLICLEFLF